MNEIIFLGMVFLLLIVPLILTLFNIINLFKKKKIKPGLIDTLTFVLGVSYTIILYHILGFKHYTEPIVIGDASTQLHSPIAVDCIPTVIAILILGVISYILVRVKKLDLPPLVIVASMSGILICSTYMVIFIIQICKNLTANYIYFIPYFLVFPINYMLCSIRAVMEIIKVYKEKNIGEMRYNSEFLNKCNRLLINVDDWPKFAVVLALPMLVTLIIILTLFGQTPDAIIRAFLDTSDWTLSGREAPPPVYHDAHYLCTVSLRGHKKVVKPTRLGIRRGEKIIVNRQLCVANAFEDLIQERMPKFHHFIRYIYDKYGYPLSKHINNAWQADLTYILMKPLEWIFVFVLYLFDTKQENRIAVQYTKK